MWQKAKVIQVGKTDVNMVGQTLWVEGQPDVTLTTNFRSRDKTTDGLDFTKVVKSNIVTKDGIYLDVDVRGIELLPEFSENVITIRVEDFTKCPE